jgi:hypothetical protein
MFCLCMLFLMMSDYVLRSDYVQLSTLSLRLQEVWSAPYHLPLGFATVQLN